MSIVELTRAEWAAACPSLDCVYLDPRWLVVVEEVYPRVRAVRLAWVESGKVVWMLPLVEISPLLRGAPMWISVGFGNYGGFIRCTGDAHPGWHQSLNDLRGYLYSSKAVGIELRGESEVPSFERSSYFKRFSLHLPASASVLWDNGLSSNARNMIRKATKAGVTTVVGSPGDLSSFQRLYEEQAKEHGTPIHDQAWFPTIARQFEGQCYTVIASKNQKAIGAALVLDGSATSYLHSVVWSRDHRDIPVADLLYWDAIRESIARKKDRMDFGRTRPVEGQLFFKRKWGAEELELPYSYMLKPGRKAPLIVPESAKYRWATRLWRAMPLQLHRTVGPFLRSHIAS